MTEAWAWLALAGLGVFHGLNPAMGWLFAVARGLHERRLRAVLRSVPPIAAGHLLSLAAVATVAGLTALAVHADVLRRFTAPALIGFGVFKLLRPKSHPRWVGFRISAAGLLLWSLLMSTAHGAGLMLLPILLGPAHHGTAQMTAMGHPMVMGMSTPGPQVGSVVGMGLALLVHTGAMLLAMSMVSVVFYAKVGLQILRSAWVNVEWVWAAVLILSGLSLYLL